MSMMVSFVLSFFPRDVLDEILNLIESVSEDFPSYSSTSVFLLLRCFSGIVLNPGVLRVPQYIPVESSSLSHHRPYS